MILSLAHTITLCDAQMKKGEWNRCVGFNLHDKILGIIGLGNIGKEVAKRTPAFGMRTFANDIVYDEAFLKGNPDVERKELTELLTESDIITLHVPLTEKTKNMINASTISSMKDGVYIVNTARGPVVDEKALLDALKKGKVAGAALEVFSKEPPFSDPVLKELVEYPHVIATPHVATFTPEVQYAVASRIFDNILAASEGRLIDADQVV
jgi:phosphoglycerate dehydrogenase-like enzyme